MGEETQAGMNIYQRMAAVMKAVSYVQKEDKKVNNQYTFVSHDAVVVATRQPILDAGLIYTVAVTRHSQDGNRTEADIEMTFINIDNPEETITVPSFGYGVDSQDKGPGKAVSYAVKYALLKTFALETGDDPEKDLTDAEPGEKPGGDAPLKPPPRTNTQRGSAGAISDKQKEMIANLQADAEVSGEDMIKVLTTSFEGKSIAGLSCEEAALLIGRLETKANQVSAEKLKEGSAV